MNREADLRSEKKQSKRQSFDEDELKRLEKLVFGDPSHLFENSVPKKKKKKRKNHDSLNSFLDDDDNDDEDDTDGVSDTDYDRKNVKLPAWEDEDDVKTSIKMAHSLQGRPNDNHVGRPSDSYSSLLKRRFENIVGNPKWAEIKKKKDESDDDESLLQRCGNFIEKRSNLSSGVIKFNPVKDLNAETRCEGKVIKSIEFHHNSALALVAGINGVVSLFEVDGKNNSVIQKIKFPRFDIHCARFSHDGEQFIVGSKSNRHFYTYDMTSGRSILVPIHHETKITNLQNFEVSPDGRIIAVCGKFGNIFLLSAKTKEWLGSLQMNGEVNGISFNSDGSLLYSHGDDGKVYVWNMKTRTCINKFVDDGCLNGTSVCISPNDKLLACGSSSGVVNVYDTTTLHHTNSPKPLKILLNLTTSITSLKFNHSSEILGMASFKKDTAIRLMHYPSLTVFKNFPNQNRSTGMINCISFSPHSGFMAVGTNCTKALLYRLNYFGNY
ncbi:U3 small nucleolar RNA-associated protein 18 homolog wicked [Lycorma delicatula]|uniref:U3 small nucleolar RNA-associated protein 18 homolog wicked n=1 Tax=Lycorma delicatula TaxID=130591 RepID=UPI003F50F6C7